MEQEKKLGILFYVLIFVIILRLIFSHNLLKYYAFSVTMLTYGNMYKALFLYPSIYLNIKISDMILFPPIINYDI